MLSGRLETPASVKNFALAGRAHLTIRSQKTGERFTYRVKKSPDGRVHFVSVLTGSDNVSSYDFLGTIKADRRFHPSPKSKIRPEAPSSRAWEWFSRNAIENDHLPETVEVWHEGRCGRCGRQLTVPESIESGFGPECTKYLCQSV